MVEDSAAFDEGLRTGVWRRIVNSRRSATKVQRSSLRSAGWSDYKQALRTRMRCDSRSDGPGSSSRSRHHRLLRGRAARSNQRSATWGRRTRRRTSTCPRIHAAGALRAAETQRHVDALLARAACVLTHLSRPIRRAKPQPLLRGTASITTTNPTPHSAAASPPQWSNWARQLVRRSQPRCAPVAISRVACAASASN